MAKVPNPWDNNDNNPWEGNDKPVNKPKVTDFTKIKKPDGFAMGRSPGAFGLAGFRLLSGSA